MVIKKKGLAILGSTGSIGTQPLDIVRSFPNNFKVIGLAANNNIACLKNQLKNFLRNQFHSTLVHQTSIF